jgi:hypothetical protein
MMTMDNNTHEGYTGDWNFTVRGIETWKRCENDITDVYKILHQFFFWF